MVEIRNNINKVIKLKETYSDDLNKVNYAFWPIIAKKKKNLFYASYYMLISFIVLFMFGFWYLLRSNKEESQIYIFFGSSVLLVISSIIIYMIIKRKFNKANKEWQIALKPLTVTKKNLDDLTSETIRMILDSFGNDKDAIVNEIGDSFDDLVEYYNSHNE